MEIYIIIILCIIFYLLFITEKTKNIEKFGCQDDKNACNASLNARTDERDSCNTSLIARISEKNNCNATLSIRTGERNNCNNILNTRTGERDTCNTSLNTCNTSLNTSNTSLNDYKGFHEICNSALNMRTDELNASNTNLNARTRERDTCTNTLNTYINYFNDFNLLRGKYSDIFPISNIDASQEAMGIPTLIAMYPLQKDFTNLIQNSSINITPKFDLSGYVFTNNALSIKTNYITNIFTFSLGQASNIKAISYWLYYDYNKIDTDETYNNDAPIIKDTYNKILENYIPNKKWICVSINIGMNMGDLNVYVSYDGIVKKINDSQLLQDREQKRAISYIIIKISLLSLINNFSVYDRALSENNIRELNVRTPIRTDIINYY